MVDQERREVEQCADQEQLQAHALRLFHRLWGQAKDQAAYDKPSWVMLQTVLLRLGVKA